MTCGIPSENYANFAEPVLGGEIRPLRAIYLGEVESRKHLLPLRKPFRVMLGDLSEDGLA